jgi:hypothetical protein
LKYWRNLVRRRRPLVLILALCVVATQGLAATYSWCAHDASSVHLEWIAADCDHASHDQNHTESVDSGNPARLPATAGWAPMVAFLVSDAGFQFVALSLSPVWQRSPGPTWLRLGEAIPGRTTRLLV